jgi:molybdopterin/thiamine biosynthesis adenylyltransferase
MMAKVFFCRAGRAGPSDVIERQPELAPLRHATVSLFGLGALGAPIAMELARAGVRLLRVLDYDFVDPATTTRWPFGLHAAGLQKAAVIFQAIKRDYPFTDIEGFNYCLGALPDPSGSGPTAHEIMRDMTRDTSLILDATAEIGIQQFLGDFAAEARLPYLGVDATPGAWGGRIVCIIPGTTEGCWLCYKYAQRDHLIPEPPMHPDGELQPVGCSEPTFTGGGFDLAQVALTAVRIAVSTLCAGTPGAYPTADWDVTTVALRALDGTLILPQFQGHRLERHPECPRCTP